MMKCYGSPREAPRLAQTLSGVTFSHLACFVFIVRVGLIRLAAPDLIILP